MANSSEHNHTAAENGLIHYKRTVEGELYDTGKRIDRGDLAGPPQQYIDHAGRPTTVKEYTSGRVDVFVGSDQPKYWAKERIVSEARQLATSTEWKDAGNRYRALLDEWKSVGRISDRGTDDLLWRQFNEARQEFNSRRQQHFDERNKAQEKAVLEKERIAARAMSIASSSDTKGAGEEMKRLMDEWKRAGRADKASEERLWAQFDRARKQLQDRRTKEFEKRKAEWSANKTSKEQLVRQAEALAGGSDLKSAGEQMRTLSERWKQIGPCDKADNDRLWQQFNAARAKLNDRRSREFEKRKAEWAANRASKERIVSRAESLAESSDLRSAGDEMRSLGDQWKQVGPCDKADNDRLWSRFNAARTRLKDRRQRDFEERNAERRRKAFEYVSRLEDQLYRVESSIRNAEEAYSRALSARSPSFNNPNWSTIAMKQQERQSNARSRLASLESRRSDIINKLSNARSQANSL